MPRQFDIPQVNLQALMHMTPNSIKLKGKPGKKKPRRKTNPKSIWQRKTECRVVKAQYGAGSRVGFQRSRPKHPIWYNEMRTVVVCPSGNRHYSYVRFYGPPGLKTPVWVWCSCEFFAYTYEWVLAQMGASTVAPGYDNRGVQIRNEPPDIRNEHGRAGLCKHLLLTAEVALRQTKDFAGEQAEEATARGASIRTAAPTSPYQRFTQW